MKQHVPAPERRPGKSGKKMKRKRRMPWRLIGLLILVLVVAGGVLLFAPVFRIRSVVITGNELVSKDEIVKAMGNVDENLFRFSGGQLKKQLMTIPGIRDVKVHKKLPDQLELEIVETYALASIQTDHGTLYLDNQGIITKQYNEETNRMVPFPLETQGMNLKEGEALSSDTRFLDVLLQLRRAEWSGKVTKVRFETTPAVAIMYNDIVIQFGTPDDIIAKFSRLKVVLNEIEKSEVRAQEILLDQGKNPIVVTQDAQSELPKASEAAPTKNTEGEP